MKQKATRLFDALRKVLKAERIHLDKMAAGPHSIKGIPDCYIYSVDRQISGWIELKIDDSLTEWQKYKMEMYPKAYCLQKNSSGIPWYYLLNYNEKILWSSTKLIGILSVIDEFWSWDETIIKLERLKNGKN